MKSPQTGKSIKGKAISESDSLRFHLKERRKRERMGIGGGMGLEQKEGLRMPKFNSHLC